MENKNITCVITTHNRDAYLKEAVYSAINQTTPPFEIIISNNLPNEKTQTLINTISEKSTVPIKYIEHSMKGRGSISANLAASMAKGDYIAFLDDDDMWEPDYFENIIDLISEKKSRIIYTWFLKLQNNKKIPYKELKENLKMQDILLVNPGCGISNLIVERKLFVSLGGFDDYIHLSNDKDFLIRALYYGYEYYVLKKNLVVQRKHNDEQLTDINRDFLIGMKRFFKKHEWMASPVIKFKFYLKYWKMYIKMLKFNISKYQFRNK